MLGADKFYGKRFIGQWTLRLWTAPLQSPDIHLHLEEAWRNIEPRRRAQTWWPPLASLD